MSTIKIEMHNNLNNHNVGPVFLTIPDNYVVTEDEVVILTDEQVRNIRDHFCSDKNCNCGSTGPLQKSKNGQWGISIYWVTGSTRATRKCDEQAKKYHCSLLALGIALNQYYCSESTKTEEEYLDNYFGYKNQYFTDEGEAAIIACEDGKLGGAMPADI